MLDWGVQLDNDFKAGIGCLLGAGLFILFIA